MIGNKDILMQGYTEKEIKSLYDESCRLKCASNNPDKVSFKWELSPDVIRHLQYSMYTEVIFPIPIDPNESFFLTGYPVKIERDKYCHLKLIMEVEI